MTDMREQLIEMEELRARSIANGDIETLSAMTSEDYIHVDAHGNLRTKSDFLNTLSKGPAKYISYISSDNIISIHHGTAIVTGCFENTNVTPDGVKHSRTGRHVRVYIQRNNQWINTLHQGTEIQK
ncbi:nuclear transport factor 2 family protein [Kordiimonas pumila]|uniref:Nuclear transport factor 2 family protein n=1 Tax=Kordiimonas pumila TaxID=2161677 RepID=A0ABV7D7E8_9PROT|nr:nuclear transport factor 2 family protein [Kordiimonas pumila]